MDAPQILIDKLQSYADDPMWDAHAEIPKSLLCETIAALKDKPPPFDWSDDHLKKEWDYQWHQAHASMKVLESFSDMLDRAAIAFARKLLRE